MLDHVFSWLYVVGVEIIEFGLDFYRVVTGSISDLIGDSVLGDLVSEMLGPFSDLSIAVIATTGLASAYIVVSVYKFFKGLIF